MTAYRAAIALNFMMIGFSYGILARIQRMMNTTVGKERIEGQICAAIAVLYPPMLFYAQMTMTEVLLMAGYLLLILLFGRYVHNPGHKGLMLILMVNFCMYLVHMRTVGTLAVCTGVLIYIAVMKRRDYREALLILILTILSLWIAKILKQEISAYLYHNLNWELYEINTYEGQIEKIKYIFSKAGWSALAAGFCGKILYLGISTYGIAFWGMFRLIREIRYSSANFVSGDGQYDLRKAVSFLVMASTLAQIGISTVYNVIPDSYDRITFGRYHDYVIPLLIAIGIMEIIEHIRDKKRYLQTAAFLLILLSVVVSVYGEELDLTQSKGYFMAGMSFFDMGEFSPAIFYAVTCVAGIGCMYLHTAIFSWYSRVGHPHVLFFCALFSLIFAMRLEYLYLYPFNELAYQDMRVAEKAEMLIGEETYEPYITYMDYNDISAIGLMQFVLRDSRIRVVSGYEGVPYDEISEHSIILLGADDPVQEELEALYDRELISGHFVLLFNDR